jgi:hypothetical protein
MEKQLIEKDGKQYEVRWTDKPPGEQEPVFVEVDHAT